MNILSLFDGMSCGQQALNRCGFTITNYFASEIDKHAIKVTQHNYPNTIQLGSVVNVNGYELPKIDLLMGGSPCQSFSFAGKRKGMSTKDEQEILILEHYLQLKSEGFEFEGQSYLFWEYMRLLNELRTKNPNIYFLLENVEMGEKWELVLSRAIGVKGIHINSALVSAQNRKRIYWTNIGMKPSGLFGDLESIIEHPKDKGILLKDILESEVDEKYFLSEKMIQGFQKHKDRHEEKGTGFIWQPTEGDKKGSCLRANAALSPTDNSIIVHNLQKRDPNRPSIQKNKNAGGSGPLSRKDEKTYCLDAGNSNGVEIIGLTEVRTEEAKKIRRETGTNPKREKELSHRTDGKTGAILTSLTNDNLIEIIQTNNRRLNETIEKHINNLEEGTLLDSYNQDIHKDKSITISTRVNASSCTHIYKNSRIRRLTPIECERLQTVEDNYSSCVSDSQRYKMLGNGWTIDVICYILNYLKHE